MGTAVLKWGGDYVAANACALEFVHETAPGLCPRLLGADLNLGFTLQEDLGQGASLVDVLSGEDPVAAEVALAYTRTGWAGWRRPPKGGSWTGSGWS